MIEITLKVPDDLAETVDANCDGDADAYFNDMVVKMLYRFKEQNQKNIMANIPKEELDDVIKTVKEKNKNK